MTSGCTGQCCVAFPLNAERNELSVELVAMLVSITLEEAAERHARLYPDNPMELRGGPARDGQYYRCVHWDEETRLCGIYEARPNMCRYYPGYDDGRACEYGCDCTDHGPTRARGR